MNPHEGVIRQLAATCGLPDDRHSTPVADSLRPVIAFRQSVVCKPFVRADQLR
jgi:hypothetical protein